MMRSWAYNRLGVLMGTSWSVSCPHWHGLRDNSLPMITPFLSQGGFCSTAKGVKSPQNFPVKIEHSFCKTTFHIFGQIDSTNSRIIIPGTRVVHDCALS